MAVVLLVAAATCGELAHADTIQVGSNTRDSVSLMPFDDLVGTTRYQQVYDASEFSGTFTINTIAFLAARDFEDYGADVEIRLSHTTKAPNALSATLGDNVTGSETLVFDSAVFQADLEEDTWSLAFDLSTSFEYDPTAGNLLMDIRIADQSAGIATAFRDLDSYGAASLAYDSATYGAGTHWSFLITRFDSSPPSTPVPEPGTMLLLGCGLAGLALRRSRHWR